MKPTLAFIYLVGVCLSAFGKMMYILGFGQLTYPDAKTQFVMNGKSI